MPARSVPGALPGRPNWLLLHGLGDNAHVWDACRRNLLGISAVVPDLAGHGSAPWRRDGAYRIESYASALMPLLTDAPDTRWVVAGHSLGASVAAAIARRAGRQIAGVVLVEPAGEAAATRHIQDRLSWLCAARFASKADYASELAARLPLAMPALIERFAAASLCEGPEGDWRVMFDPRVVDFDLAEDAADCIEPIGALPTLGCPILLVRGAGSAALSRSSAESLAAQLGSGCALEIIPRAGHAVPLDNPVALAAALSRFAH
jgi:pimeloyl-ACP methyl ester carboxylesterase